MSPSDSYNIVNNERHLGCVLVILSSIITYPVFPEKIVASSPRRWVKGMTDDPTFIRIYSREKYLHYALPLGAI